MCVHVFVFICVCVCMCACVLSPSASPVPVLSWPGLNVNMEDQPARGEQNFRREYA